MPPASPADRDPETGPSESESAGHGLDDFGRRLAEAEARQARSTGRSPASAERSEGMAAGLRIAVELAAAVAVGAGIGLVLDQWLGTKPWLLIVFFFVGCGAGFLNVYRTAQELDRRTKERRRAERGGGSGSADSE